MTKEKELLLSEFIKLAKKGYVKGVNNITNSVGLTFESQLGKKPDSDYLPDYNGIELKCTTRFSRYPISLFSKSFDGPNDFEMNRLLKTYGKKDIQFEGKFQLFGVVRTRRLTLINSNYFKLEVSREDKKIYLLVYDMNKKLIEKLSYIDFCSLEERIMLKLSNLSLIYASKMKKKNSQYFRYYKIVFYKIKDFDIFLDLLEKDKIEVTLCARVSRSGVECGRQRNKNLVFKILKESVDELFLKEFEYNFDTSSKANETQYLWQANNY